jgi:hypothetical protein
MEHPKLKFSKAEIATIREGGIPDHQTPLRQAFAQNHPLHEDFAMAYSNIGGVVALTDWAEEAPGEFLKLMVKLAPAPKEIIIDQRTPMKDINDALSANEAAQVYASIISEQ